MLLCTFAIYICHILVFGFVSFFTVSHWNKVPLIQRHKIRLAKQMQLKSICIEDGPPAVYSLPMREVVMNDKQQIAKFHISQPLPKDRSPEKVFMILGATGVGKTTMIHSIANYIMGVHWEDEFRFKLVMEAEMGNTSEAHSQTRWITAYTFHRMEGSKVPFTLTIVDTPGFGDTEGLQRDKDIARQIEEFFSLPGESGIDHLDGVGFISQAALARLTTTQKYIYDSILSTFGKDISSNIFLMVTFADGSPEPPVVAAVKAAQIPFTSFFTFNNCSLFSDNADSDDGMSFDEVFWQLCSQNHQEFFTKLATMEPKSLQLTKQVLEERQQLETIIQGLQQKINTGLLKINELQQEEHVLKQREEDILANKDFSYEVKTTKVKSVDISGSGLYVTNCLECSFTCHYPCPYPLDEDKYRCTAMVNQGDPCKAKCSICPGRCSWKVHVNTTSRFEVYEETETRTSEQLKKRYYEALSGQSSVKTMIANMEDHLAFLQGKVLEMSREAKDSMQRLDEIALKPNPLSEMEYIDLLIESERQEGKLGFQQRIKYYQDVKQRAVIMSKLQNTRHTQTGAQVSTSDKWDSFKFW